MNSTKMLMRQGCFGLLTAAIAVMSWGCTPKVNIPVQSPADISTIGIKKVAVGSFEIAMADQSIHIERNGEWQTKKLVPAQDQKLQIAKQIRAKIVNELSTSPYFSLVYTDEFASLENDEALRKLVSAEGYKTRQVDAVINGKIWIQLQKTDGSDVDKSEMRFVQGGSSDGLDLSVQKVLWWPYKSIRGNMTMEIKMTRLIPTEVIAVNTETGTFAHRVGGKSGSLLDSVKSATEDFATAVKGKNAKFENSNAVFPSFGQLISDLATSIATNFARRVAVTERWVSYPLATDGDVQGRLLVEAGAYEMAINRLQQVTSKKKHADDLYNLGLAFEAIGEYGLAQTAYTDAWEADKNCLLYAQGLGRVEKILRENPRVKRQLAEKNR